MSVATVVTMGYGSFGTVNFLPTIGYSIGAVLATTKQSIDYTEPRMRIHCNEPLQRVHYTEPQSRIHFTDINR